MPRRRCRALAWWSLTLAGRGAALVAPPARCRRRAPARQLLRRPAVLDPNDIAPTLRTAYDSASTLATAYDSSTLATAYDFQGFQGSYASLYATLFLYVISFPGLWSTIKRASKIALVQQTYEFPGEKAPVDAKSMREVAGDVMAYMQANNYEVAEAGETITFKGKIAPEVSQAAFLVFCTFICFASLALVLQIQVPTVAGVDVGSYWFLTTLLSPYAGLYYWKSASDNEQREVKVKLSANDDESQTLMVVRGDKKDVQRMEEEMDLQQEGMIRVRGVFDYSKTA